MERFTPLKRVWEFVKVAVVAIGRFFRFLYQKIWMFLRLRLPFVEALVQRHINNPSTVFVDAAIFILSLYFIFGITGFIVIYPKKAETRLAETLAVLYPFPAGEVNNSFVWSHRFLQRLRFLNNFNHQAPKEVAATLPNDTELRSQVYNGLIEDKIIYLEAKKRGIRVTQDEVNVAVAKQGKADELTAKINKLYGMSLDDFRTIVAEQLLKEKVKKAVLTTIRIRHILVDDEAQANDIKKQLDGGRDFAEAAKQYSKDAQSANAGGDIGYWRKGDLSQQVAPAFEDAAFSLQVNQISGPVKTNFGFHIIQVTERTGDNLQTYQEWLSGVKKDFHSKRYIKL